jgi:hypothetical protein
LLETWKPADVSDGNLQVRAMSASTSLQRRRGPSLPGPCGSTRAESSGWVRVVAEPPLVHCADLHVFSHSQIAWTCSSHPQPRPRYPAV